MRTVVCLAGAVLLVVTLASRAAAQTCPDVTGCWEGDYTNSVSGAFELALLQAGDQLSGTQIVHDVTFGTMSGSVSGTITCDALEFTTVFPGATATTSGQVAGDCMGGTFTVLETSGTWQACRVACCGNGVINFAETCDDANGSAGDGCSDTCVVEPGFTCAGQPSVCTTIVCGNGVLQPGEQCDDGNTAAGDCCQPDCTLDPAGTDCAAPPFPGACDENGNCVAIPTLSEWGVVLLSLLMLGAVLGKRQRGVAIVGR